MAVKGKAGPGGFGRRVTHAAKEAGQLSDGPTTKQAEQQELLKQDVPVVPMIVGDKYCVRFVKEAGFKKVEDERMVGLDFSTALTPGHDDLLDSNILAAVKFLRKSHVGYCGDIEIPNQTIEISLASDMDPVLKLVAAEATNVCVDHVTEKGSGKENRVLRLSWRVMTEASEEVVEFIRTHFDDSVWIEMHPAQGVLTGQKDAA